MNKINFLFILCVITNPQDSYGKPEIFSMYIRKINYALAMNYRRGEYSFPSTYSGNGVEHRKIDKNGNKLILFCPVDMKKYAEIDQYCLTPIRDDENICKNPVKPVLIKSKQLDIKCGPDGKSVYYDFVYRICLQDNDSGTLESSTSMKNTKDYLIYRICYNLEKNETIFTYHEISSLNLIFNDFLINEYIEKFEIDTYSYEIQSDTFTNMKKAFNNLNTYLKKRFKEPEKLKFNNLEKLFLVLPDDMAFAAQKIPVYHYINVKPAWKFTIEMWNKINLHIQLLIQDTKCIQINGTQDVWKSNNKPIFLDNDETITVPMYFWKLVYIPAKKALMTLIVHNVPHDNVKIDKLCEGNKNEYIIHHHTRIPPELAYFCEPSVITDSYNLPEELDLLRRKEHFYPLVLSYNDGKYNPPRIFNGYNDSSIGEEARVSFCPPLADEIKDYDVDCLVPNENANHYCIKPVKPNLFKSKNVDHKCYINDESVLSESAGYKLCLKNEKAKMEETDTSLRANIYEFQTYEICHMGSETITFHKIISPELLLNKNLESENDLNYLVKNLSTQTNLNEFKILHSNYAQENLYDSYNNELLTDLFLVPPSNMAFAAWKKSAYLKENVLLSFSNVERIWNIINKQLQIQAIEENRELIHLSGTIDNIMDSKESNYDDRLAKYFWKVVYTPNMDKSIAIIVHNEIEKEDMPKKLCNESVCGIEKWSADFGSILEDLVYCCNANVIAKRFNLPETEEILELKDYYLPLILRYSIYNRYVLPDSYNGLVNLIEEQALFCPAETEELKTYFEYCLFRNEKKIPYCKEPVQPFLIRFIADKNYCDQEDDDAEVYEFKYTACVKKNEQKVDQQDSTVYRICFNSKTQETRYAFNFVRSTALLFNSKLANERQITYKLNDSSSIEDLKFTKIKENLEKKYTFPNGNNYQLKPLLLASPGEMPFALLKKPLYHYINVKLAWANVIKIWDTINEEILNMGINEKPYYSQVNGSMNNLKINRKILFLDDGVTPIPEFFWKIVNNIDSLRDIVIIVHNVPEKEYVLKKYCKENLCTNKPELKFLTLYGDMVYCCDSKELRSRHRFNAG